MPHGLAAAALIVYLMHGFHRFFAAARLQSVPPQVCHVES